MIAIPEEIKDVLVGIFHGDGHIVTRSSTNNPRLVYAQTSVAHKKYCAIVYSLYMPFCEKDSIPQSIIVRDNRTKKKYTVLYLSQLCSLPAFMFLNKCFMY